MKCKCYEIVCMFNYDFENYDDDDNEIFDYHI